MASIPLPLEAPCEITASLDYRTSSRVPAQWLEKVLEQTIGLRTPEANEHCASVQTTSRRKAPGRSLRRQGAIHLSPARRHEQKVATQVLRRREALQGQAIDNSDDTQSMVRRDKPQMDSEHDLNGSIGDQVAPVLKADDVLGHDLHSAPDVSVKTQPIRNTIASVKEAGHDGEQSQQAPSVPAVIKGLCQAAGQVADDSHGAMNPGESLASDLALVPGGTRREYNAHVNSLIASRRQRLASTQSRNSDSSNNDKTQYDTSADSSFQSS